MGYLVMLGLIIVDLLDALGREIINCRVWVGHQDWRMRSDDELGIGDHGTVFGFRTKANRKSSPRSS